MNKLLLYKMPPRSPLWMKFRNTGLTEEEAKSINPKLPAYPVGWGASEAGQLIGLTYKYESLAETFLSKVGTKMKVVKDNPAMHWGRRNEKNVGDTWRCWDPETGYLDSYNKWEELKDLDISDHFNPDTLIHIEDRKLWFTEYKKWERSKRRELRKSALIRDCKTYNGSIVNPDFPYLFTTLDYYANPGSFRALDGEVMPYGFPVECKTMSTDNARGAGKNMGKPLIVSGIEVNNFNMNNMNIPLPYIAQIHVQMMITGTYYAEIPILIGSNQFEVNKYERNDELCELIRTTAKYQAEKIMVCRAMEGIRQACIENKDIDGARRAKEMIYNNMPGGGIEERYNEVAASNYVAEIPKVDAPDWILDAARRDSFWQVMEVEVGKKRNLYKNMLSKFFMEKGAEMAEMGDFGNIKYKFHNNRAKFRTPSVKLKSEHKVDKDHINNILNFIPDEYYK